MKFKFSQISIFLLGLIVFLNPVFAQANSTEKPSIVVLYTKSGDITEDFENLTDVVRFSIEQYNILYKKNLDFNLIEIDDKGDPNLAEKELNAVFEKQKPLAIIGPLYSNVALSLKDFVAKKNVPMISVFATHNDLTKNSNHIFRICASNNSLVKSLASHLIPQIQKNKLNVTLFKDLTDFYSTDLADSFKQSFSPVKTSVNEVLFRGITGLESLKDINSKVWNPTKKDLILLPTQDIVSSKILTAMESEPYLVATIDPVNFKDIVKKMKKGKIHIRLVSTSQWLPGKSDFSKQIEAAYTSKFKKELKISSALTFDATIALAAAYERSLKSKNSILETLKDGTKQIGLTGNTALGPDGERIAPQNFIKEDILQ